METMKDLIKSAKNLKLYNQDSFINAINLMEHNNIGIVLIVDKKCRLKGVITSGDIRKAILKGVQFSDPVTMVINKKPIIIHTGISKGEVARLFDENRVYYVPVVDHDNTVLGIIAAKDFHERKIVNCPVLIMAGGLGTRMMPLTKDTPKPLLPVLGKPMIQHIIESLREFGANQFYVSVNYHAEMIKNFLKDGSWLRINIKYINENKRLGTAGALSEVKSREKNGNLLIVNSDVITDLNYQSMYDFHENNESDITIAIKNFELKIPYGVLNMDFNRVISISEKPTEKKYINAGIYLLNIAALPKLKKNTYLDMTDLINTMINQNKRIYAYSIETFWADLGQYKDYLKANKHHNKIIQLNEIQQKKNKVMDTTKWSRMPSMGKQ